MSTIWILTEERPKKVTIEIILDLLHKKTRASYNIESIRIRPIIKNGKFCFRYKVEGLDSSISNEVIIIPVSGKSSFVDFLVYVQKDEPRPSDQPMFVIEETKTDDSEARNMTYQRCSKFVYSKHFYPQSEQVLIYSLRVAQKQVPTATYIFATRMLATYGVSILGKREESAGLFRPFESIDELINEKNGMEGTKNGVSVRITRSDGEIRITARLEKAGRLASDPSIGQVAIISACLRELGWKGRIIITEHGLDPSKIIGSQNKFNFISAMLEIELDEIRLKPPTLHTQYWGIEKEKEKTASIFAHLICEDLDYFREVYENHGGCERGYFYYYDEQANAIPLAIPKYSDKKKYKEGDKKYIVYIPDLVIFDSKRKEVINLEGKTYANRKIGVQELNNYDYFEKQYIHRYYPGAKVIRGLTLAGSGNQEKAMLLKETSLYLDNEGAIHLSKNAPKIIKDAVGRLSL